MCRKSVDYKEIQMSGPDLQKIHETYFALLGQQQFEGEVLDYSILDQHKPSLHKLAELGNSEISVFDLHQKQHVFNSSNFGQVLGYSLEDTNAKGVVC